MKVISMPLGPYMANCYVLLAEDGKCAVIDPGYYEDALVRCLRENNADVVAILLTHGHADHMSAVAELQKQYGATVYIHKLDAMNTNSGYGLSENIGYPNNPFTADVLLSDGDKITFGGEELSVLHTPGHTPGGVCYIHEKDHLLFTGDTLFSRTIGRVDLPGGSKEDILKSLFKLYNLPGDYTVYPGHERHSTLDFERTRNIFLRRMGRT